MTFRRDKLLRLAKAERLVLVSSYSFDDMYGASCDNTQDKPVRVIPKDPAERERIVRYDGTICWVREDEFEGNCGRAYTSDRDGADIVHLYVHSNSNYDFRILPEVPEDKKAKAAKKRADKAAAKILEDNGLECA